MNNNTIKKYVFTFLLFLCNITLHGMEGEKRICPVASLKQQCINTILKHPRRDYRTPVVPDELYEEIRATFSEQSDLLPDIYAHTIKQNIIAYPSGYISTIMYDKKRKNIAANMYSDITINWDTNPIVHTAHPYYYMLDLHGQTIATHHNTHYESRHTVPPLSLRESRLLAQHYNLPLQERSSLICINSNTFLEKSATDMKLYNVSKTKKVKDFCENRIPLEQLSLLVAIEQARHKKTYLRLTEHERATYNSLLPDIKKAIEPYVITFLWHPSSLGKLLCNYNPY